MRSFTYQYQGQILHSIADNYIVDGYNRYRVSLDGGYCVIAPSGYPGPDGSIIWVQQNYYGEFILPNELLQALGQGIEKARLSTIY
jgi:hypothetical protein